MNQILSVETPKQSNRRKVKGESKKASTKSVVIFFSIVLVIFGIALLGVGIYTMLNKDSKAGRDASQSSIKFDVTQNATELNLEVSGTSEIAKAEYRWSQGQSEEVNGNGTNSLELNINIPSGTNTFEIIATDINGKTETYTQEFVGPKQPKVELVGQEGNKLQIVCNEEQEVKYIAFYYDNEEEQRQDVNGTNANLSVNVKEGEHTLTVKVVYADGTIGVISNKLFVPTIDVKTDRINFFVNISDSRKIADITINFNGVEEQVKGVNSETFEKSLKLQDGENRLILTVSNTDGIQIIKKIRWMKNN